MQVQSKQNAFRVAPLKTAFLQRARAAGLDDQQQTVEKSIALGGEPCRDVLRRARPGEEIILASYCPFEISSPYKEYGPVFILAVQSDEEVELAALPFGGTRDYLTKPFVLRAYSREERIVDGILTNVTDAEQNLQQLFMKEEVAFVLARFTGYGCYACRIERA